MHTEFVLDALEQALYDRKPSDDGSLTHHSDRGSQCLTTSIRGHRGLSAFDLQEDQGTPYGNGQHLTLSQPWRPFDNRSNTSRELAMHRTLATLLRLALAASLLTVIGLAAALVERIQQQDVSRQWVEHTHQVIDQLREARIQSLLAGAALRNFLILPLEVHLSESRKAARETS